MPGRHRLVVLRGVSVERLERLHAALGGMPEHPESLIDVLSQLPRSGDPVDPALEDAWRVDPTDPGLLVDLVRSDPRRWAPLFVRALFSAHDPAGPWWHRLAAVRDLSIPEGHATLIVACSAYRARFPGGPVDATVLLEQPALVRALGGEPTRAEPDFRQALRDAWYAPGEVMEIAHDLSTVRLSPSVPDLSGLRPPQPVDHFEIPIDLVRRAVPAVAQFYLEAAADGLGVSVQWGINAA